MDAPVLFLVLCTCTLSVSQPLGDAMRLRSDYGVYASDYSRDYEPYMFAAIPLHAPVPVLHVLSAAPLTRSRDSRPAPSPSAPRPAYARPPYERDAEYAASAHGDYDAEYEVLQYAAAATPYTKHYSSQPYSGAADEPTILYARPTPLGGYTYRKPSHKQAAKRVPAAAAAADTPYIIRVHKYRLVKDR